MDNTPGSNLRSRDIFERLADHGIRNYGTIKIIVTFDIPQPAYLFVRQFDGRTLAGVLKQIERWKKFLNTDFLLPASEKTELISRINQTQLLVGNALIEANSPCVGDWDLKYEWIPTGTDEEGNPLYVWPNLRIKALHQKTGEIRHSSISYGAPDASDLGPNPFQRAFEELRLWDQLEKGSLRGCLVSSRRAQGWPVYTQIIVPRLYDFLVPQYPKRAHHSEKRDAAGETRNAIFPKELLEDMLDILRMEHPSAFGKTTVNQLKASIQRHLAHKANRIKSPR
jgi:hypothetical protein